MAKTMMSYEQTFAADKIFKDEVAKTIVGQDINGIELFSFKGIQDFSAFTLTDGQTFDVPAPTTAETLASLTFELMSAGVI